jgi:fructosamine-3-kinase
MSCGSLELRGPRHGTFFITEFVQFDGRDLPDPDKVGALVAQLHDQSRGASQSFGTSARLFDGLLYYLSGWDTKWQTLFAKLLFQVYHYNTLSNGNDDAFDTAMRETIWYVVPRLLNALEDGDRKIEPCFIHGDLWNGNFGHATDTNRLYLFDSSGYYAHHEMELAYWRTKHHRMHQRDYVGAYFKHRPPSQPAEEFEDRILLYTLKPCLVYSSMNPGHVTRQR